MVDVNTGRAGIFAPPDRGFPEDGILATAATGWTRAEIDLAALDRIRSDGEVRGRADWPAPG